MKTKIQDFMQWLNRQFPPAQIKAIKEATCQPLVAYSAALQTSNADTTLTAHDELVVWLEHNKTYKVRVYLPLAIANASHNIKFDLAGGTATVSYIRGFSNLYDSGAATTLATSLTALNTLTDGATTTQWTDAVIEATLKVSQAGSIAVQSAQSASGASDSSIAIGAYIEAIEI